MVMNFEEAIGATHSPVNHAYREGKQALRSGHRKLVHCDDSRRITGSIDLDSTLADQPQHAEKPRWDYGLGYKPRSGSERAIWIEVHPAATSDVKQIIKKLDWLQGWLKSEAGQLTRLTEAVSSDIPAYVWIATGGIRILPHFPRARQLASRGLKMPVKKLTLP